MSLAVRCLLGSDTVDGRLTCAEVRRATPASDVDHTVLGILFALSFPVAPHDVPDYSPAVEAMWPTPPHNVYNACLSTLLAVSRYPHAVGVKARQLVPGNM